MSDKQAVNLSLHPEIVAWLDKICAKRHYTSRSILIEELIRERHDKLFGQISSATHSVEAQMEKIVKERHPKRRPGDPPAVER